MPPETIPPAYFCRGVYFTLSGRPPFRRLIYPVPVPGGLGVHITLDLAGQARFGPDVEWIDGIDYAVDPRRGDAFYAAVRRYWPGLRDGALQPGYAGIRPKISGPTEPAADFVVQGPETHGVPGLVNLYGIESPGLTASLPLADEVLRQLGRRSDWSRAQRHSAAARPAPPEGRAEDPDLVAPMEIVGSPACRMREQAAPTARYNRINVATISIVLPLLEVACRIAAPSGAVTDCNQL